jgi:TDG/mug DNA glycosylase family protein
VQPIDVAPHFFCHAAAGSGVMKAPARAARPRYLPDVPARPAPIAAPLCEVPDVVAPGLHTLFVGINPGIASALAGHHFATPTNPFWRLLHAAGFTDAVLRPDEGDRLLPLGLGITNVCPRPTRSAAELAAGELREGAAALRDKVARLRPALVALVGVSLYGVVVPGGREPGPGAKRATLAGARLFVLPNPSGLNAAYPGFEEKLVWFRRLRRALDRVEARGA